MAGTRDGAAAAAAAAEKIENELCARAMKLQFSFKDYNVPEGTHAERCLYAYILAARCDAQAHSQLFQP